MEWLGVGFLFAMKLRDLFSFLFVTIKASND